MFDIFNRFIDWFLMRNEMTPSVDENPAQIMQKISDVNVLVAEPDGNFASEEAKTALLQSIITPLNEKPGLALRLISKSFKPNSKGSLSDRFETVIKEGRAWLLKEKADLLMWGTVELEEQAVRWYFLSAIEGEANLGIPGFAESILVPFDPEQGTIDTLYAAFFAACQPSHPSHALKIGEYLLSAVEPLTKLPAGLTTRKTTPIVKTSTMGMCAVILSNIARRGEDLGWFDPAIKAFDHWEGLIDKSQDPINWALITNHRGWLYEEMAYHQEEGPELEHIEKALQLFEDVCTVFHEKDHPLEWAAVQVRIAGTCARVGRSLSEADYLQKSARAYKRSMQVYNQQKYPLNWADVMNRMAKVMMLHGQLVKGSQSLEQAGVAFQAVLKVYQKEKYPALWAATHNNLGATLFALAKRDPSTDAWVSHALTCFLNARDYYEENGKSQMVHVIDKNIARARELYAQISENMENDLLH